MSIDVDIIDGRLVARLRRSTDPVSSHSAAEKLVKSGHHGKQCTGVLLALVDNPGTTSMELSIAANLDRHLVARRLPDLEKNGVVTRGTMRRCKVGNRLATTWTATL
jgi:DNA-binding MarR family transcriptional regulator|tara:strand:+ start:979 stop:1299 length:321 start_codon:yes stop_codon:yes gene_type:complete